MIFRIIKHEGPSLNLIDRTGLHSKNSAKHKIVQNVHESVLDKF